MKDYIFVLGRDPELSVLELVSYLKARKIRYEIKEWNNEILVASVQLLNFKDMLNVLGGVAKIAKVIDDIDNEPLYMGRANKLNYAISCYGGCSGKEHELKEYLKKRFKDEMLKASLKKSGRKNPFLSPSEVVKHKLVKGGVEFILYKDYIARTIAVFDPFKYQERDLKRPVQRPMHVISIRLAKILINLAQAKKGDVLLDPFCGIGTILQEGLLTGMKVIGVDIDSSAVSAAKRNLEWISKRYSTKRTYKIIHGDSTHLSRLVGKVDAVATEPYLGPFLKKLPSEDRAKALMKPLTKLYGALLKELAKVCEGYIAIVVPRYRTPRNEEVKMPFLRLLRKHGFEVHSEHPGIKLPIIYAAKKSKILREIWVLKKQKL